MNAGGSTDTAHTPGPGAALDRSHPEVCRVVATGAARALLEQVRSGHGTVMFHQSGGCCDNSAANCYLPTDLTIGQGDVYLGDVDGTPFFISLTQYETWKHTRLILDAIEGHGGTFSLEGSTGQAFHTRSEVLTVEEVGQLRDAGRF